MQFKIFTAVALATLAAATAVPRGGGGGGGSGGDVQCCQQTTKASDPAAAGVLALLGIVLQDVNVLVGLNCSPITVIGGGNGAWSVLVVLVPRSRVLTLVSLSLALALPLLAPTTATVKNILLFGRPFMNSC